ncbi:MAG: anthranilate synthase component I [Candidatus Neomarinimicrobiota bacterium]|nr:MAG: anthranilate synthase component I [Candidatus Neomarinimicrobiota bacterium]
MKVPELNISVKKFDRFIEPVEIYEKLYRRDKYSFLYESLEKSETSGRFTILGGKPFLIFFSYGKDVTAKGRETMRFRANPYEVLRELVKSGKHNFSFPIFSGGAVGFISYDSVRFFEDIPDSNPETTGFPDMFFIFPSEIFVIDHLEGNMYLIQYYETSSIDRQREIENLLFQSSSERIRYEIKIDNVRGSVTKEKFMEMVRKAREYILAGDIFQVVLSQRFEFEISNDPYLLFKRMRITNPAPYMYYQKFGRFHVLGSSPETLVKLKGDTAITRPIAGTRRRGKTPEEDKRLEQELITNEKERAEHIMLVDLARNDLGKVCEPGTIVPEELMVVRRYSEVMHIVSTVKGKLSPKEDAFSLFAACFPAGTVSGAPKIRAMEIIDELEEVKRSVYAGAIGYFDFTGDMDFCIAIRSIFIKDNHAYLQAGAGIVADSDPEFEYQETLNKLSALFKACNGDIG